MSIKVKTATPRKLIKQIKEKIDENKIETWQYDNDGDFTHTPDQWRYRGWFRPKVTIEQDEVVFGMIGREHFNVSTEEYAIYHGRFAEMLLAHFDSMMKSIEISSLGTKYDRLKASSSK